MEALHLSDCDKQAVEDLHWALASPEVRQHAGKLVAVHKRRVVGVGTNRGSLLEEASAKAKCPWQDIVVVVAPDAKLLEIPR